MHETILEKLLEDYKAAETEMQVLNKENEPFLIRQGELRESIKELHALASYAAPKDQPCPIHGVHHGRAVGGRKTIAKFVKEALHNSPLGLNTPEIVDFISDVGWETRSPDPGSVIRNTLRRLEIDGVVVKYDGVWSLAPK